MRQVTRDNHVWRVVEPFVGGYRFWDDWQARQWEEHTLKVIDDLVAPDSMVCDIGAWIGPVSLWASREGAHVIAVEPDPVALRYLGINTRRNHANVTIVPAAISNHTGTTHIKADECGWGSSMTRAAIANEGIEVACLTMPDLFDICEVEHCSLVKIDIEGSECTVLEHVAPFLAELQIPLLCSMHQPWWTQPVNPDWFSGYGTIEGNFCGWETVLALP